MEWTYKLNVDLTVNQLADVRNLVQKLQNILDAPPSVEGESRDIEIIDKLTRELVFQSGCVRESWIRARENRMAACVMKKEVSHG